MQIRHQLRKQIKKNPRLIRSKSFIKKASLVTSSSRSRSVCVARATATNPNTANVDLGTSLGQREVDLGGSLAAEIVVPRLYDGGALGNVDIDILPSATKSLTSTSIPLLWNTQVSRGRLELRLEPARLRRHPAAARRHRPRGRAAPTQRSSTRAPSAPATCASASASSTAGPACRAVPFFEPRPDACPRRRRLRPADHGRASTRSTGRGEQDHGARRQPDAEQRTSAATRIRSRTRAQSDPGADGVTSPPTRAGHRPAHQRAEASTSPRRAPRSTRDTNDVNGVARFAEHRHRQVRWPGEPVRQHPGQGLRHRRHRLPRYEDQLDPPHRRPGRRSSRCSSAGTGRPAVFTCAPGLDRRGVRTTSPLSASGQPEDRPGHHVRRPSPHREGDDLVSWVTRHASSRSAACLMPYSGLQRRATARTYIGPSAGGAIGAPDGSLPHSALPASPHSIAPAPSGRRATRLRRRWSPTRRSRRRRCRPLAPAADRQRLHGDQQRLDRLGRRWT